MRIMTTGMPEPYVIPADKKAGRLKDQTVSRVAQDVRVVKVGELLELCSERPNLSLSALRHEIEKGNFG